MCHCKFEMKMSNWRLRLRETRGTLPMSCLSDDKDGHIDGTPLNVFPLVI